MKIEIWESKDKEKIDVLVDANGIGWVKKTDFDYIFEKYKSSLVSVLILMLAIGSIAIYLALW